MPESAEAAAATNAQHSRDAVRHAISAAGDNGREPDVAEIQAQMQASRQDLWGAMHPGLRNMSDEFPRSRVMRSLVNVYTRVPLSLLLVAGAVLAPRVAGRIRPAVRLLRRLAARRRSR